MVLAAVCALGHNPVEHNMSSSLHPIVTGLEAIATEYRSRITREGLFEKLYAQIQRNWSSYREPGRFPSTSNWVLRVAPTYTADPNHRFEKQLQKQIAICLENENWGNDMPTASGLING